MVPLMSQRVACDEALRAAIEGAYSAFENYRRPADASFCTFCYDETEIAYLRVTDLKAIDGEHARRIAWESADHWDSVDLYKHYLPRILAALAPPDRCDDLYPEHIFEVLNHHQLARWPESEKQVVLHWAQAVGEALALKSTEDAEEWRAATAKLRIEPIELPAAGSE